MNSLKKLLTASLSLVLFGTVLVACGGTNKSTANNSTNSSTSSGPSTNSTSTSSGNSSSSSSSTNSSSSTSSHTHVHGGWTIDVEPTLTTEGRASKNCECGNDEVKEILPILTDETVWSVKDEQGASCTEDGFIVYTSIYGDVTLTIDATDHTPGNWEITVSPTLDSVGKAERNCEEGDNLEEVELPVLSDDTFWTVVETVAPDCEEGGYTTYSSEYGNVTIEFNAKGHDFGEWTLVSEPTLGEDSKATVTRECGCGEIDTREVNAQKSFDVMILGNPDEYASVIEVEFSSPYTFVLNNQNKWVSNNTGVNSSSAIMNFTPKVNGTLLFDVKVSSEEMWDTFNYDGKQLSGEDNASVSIAMETGTTYQISYSKDGYSGYGDDNAIISNLRFAPEGTGEIVSYFVLSFNTMGGEEIEPVVVSNSVSVDCMPEVPTKQGFAFAGWFVDEELQTPYNNEAIKENTTVYAKWIETRTITLVKNNGEENEEIIVTVEETPNIASPKKDDFAFGGWYTTETFEEGTEYVAAPTAEDITLYAKWNEAPEYSGTYRGYNTYGQNSNTNLSTLIIDPDGRISGHRSGFVVSYDEETGMITWKETADGAEYHMWYNNGAIVYAYQAANDLPATDIYVFVKGGDIKEAKNYPLGEDNTNRIVEYTINEEKVLVFVNGQNIYANVTLANIEGNVVEVTNIIAKDIDSVIIKDKDGNIVGQYAKSGSSYVVMDGNQGTYTNGDETLVLNGCSVAILNGQKGEYEVKENFVAVCVANTYYEVVLDKDAMTYTIEKPMVTITFDAGDLASVESQIVNKNIEIILPTPEAQNYVFRGWYLDKALTEVVDMNYIPTDSVTLYGKWDSSIKVTIVYGNGLENLEQTYGNGDIPTLIKPELTNGLVFEGWYLDDTFETPYVEEAIYDSLVVYCNWKQPHTLYGSYSGVEIYSYSTSGVPTVGDYYTLNVNENGQFTSSNNDHNGNVIEFNVEKGEFVYAEENSYNGVILEYYGVQDASSRMFAYAYSSSSDSLGSDYYVVFPFESVSISGAVSQWCNMKAVLMTATLNGDSSDTVNIFIFNDKIYYDVTFTSSVEGITAENASTYQDVKIFDADGKVIAEFASNGSTLAYLDGNQGTYTNGSDTLVLNGIDKATLNNVEGTYEAKEGFFGVYVENTYYEVVLDKDAMTYTIEKPMVTITFNAGDLASVEPQTVNKNIEIILPTLEAQNYVFKGWYLDEALTDSVSNDYMPTDSVTLYAKWSEKVTLTVVYGNGLEDVTLEYAAGDYTSPVVPGFTNELAFEGWYLDETFETPYTPGYIYENTTIYCNWQGAVPYCGTYKGVNVYGTSGGVSGGSYSSSLTVDATGVTSENKDGTIINYDASTGTFQLDTGSTIYNGYYDAKNGILVYGFSANMGNDIYVFVKNATNVSTGGSSASQWNNGYTKLMTFTLEGREVETVDLFFFNDVIYYNVTFTSTTEGVTAATAYEADDLVVYDSEGNVIASFVKGDSGLTLVE